MSAAPHAKRESFELDFTSEHAKKLKDIMFDERPGLSSQFAALFNIQFLNTTETKVYCLGEPGSKDKAERGFARLVGALQSDTHIAKDLIRKVADDINPQQARPDALSTEFKAVNQNNKGAPFTPKTENQATFAAMIDENDVSFGVGPAGTGKTHVAMMKAVEALKSGKVKKILLARPAAEAGEKIGFLPGDQNEKLAPYMRPLYDELDKAFGIGKYKDMISKGTIEIVPVGFMRGRTFENVFVIVDEAQNCSKDQLKMAVTRLGNGSKMVVTGDPLQVDLTPKDSSGLAWLVQELDGVEGVSIQKFVATDIVRHPTVKRIIDVLEADDTKAAPKSVPQKRGLFDKKPK